MCAKPIQNVYFLLYFVIVVSCAALENEGDNHVRFQRSPQGTQYPNYGQQPNYGNTGAGQYPNFGSSSGQYPNPGNTGTGQFVNYGGTGGQYTGTSNTGQYPNYGTGTGNYPYKPSAPTATFTPGSNYPQYFPNGTRIPYPNTPGLGYRPGGTSGNLYPNLSPGNNYPQNFPDRNRPTQQNLPGPGYNPGGNYNPGSTYPGTNNPAYYPGAQQGQAGYPSTFPKYGDTHTNPNYGPSGYPNPNQNPNYGSGGANQYPNYGTPGQRPY